MRGYVYMRLKVMDTAKSHHMVADNPPRSKYSSSTKINISIIDDISNGEEFNKPGLLCER